MFTTKTLSFLRSLKRNNQREWFHARKDQYEQHCRQPLLSVIERLADDFAAFAPEHIADARVSPLRPYRDTRFSEDKTPLKTHVGATFPHRVLGRMNGAWFYFEVAPGWVWIGGGMWRPDTAQLQLVREHIARNLDEFEAIVSAPAFRKVGGLQGDRLTRIPRGFAKGHPAADYLQHRQFMAFREDAPTLATSKQFYAQLRSTFEAIAPFVAFLNEPLIESYSSSPSGTRDFHSATTFR
ncbi:MAG TPA: DUF2461 domain-containing protein [Vicinamibacterales bacterium]|nr:DUF2461 domain-containing protein [Vicinamibacterales bacterium]